VGVLKFQKKPLAQLRGKTLKLNIQRSTPYRLHFQLLNVER